MSPRRLLSPGNSFMCEKCSIILSALNCDLDHILYLLLWSSIGGIRCLTSYSSIVRCLWARQTPSKAENTIAQRSSKNSGDTGSQHHLTYSLHQGAPGWLCSRYLSVDIQVQLSHPRNDCLQEKIGDWKLLKTFLQVGSAPRYKPVPFIYYLR